MSMRLWSAVLWGAGWALSAQGATFGTVVPIAGQASDLALDESRGVLYIANYTADRIEVLSLASNTVERWLFPGPQPAALALSPDGRYLVVTHYGPFTTSPPTNRLSVIDLTNNQRRSYTTAYPPVGVAFGYDGLALLVTAGDFELFDPASGAAVLLDSLDGMAGQALPVDPATLPPEITRASVAASADGRRIYGVAGDVDAVILFSYNVMYRRLQALGFTTAPNLGPRVVSVAQDGSSFLAGWGLFGCDFRLHGDCDASGPLAAQFRQAAGDLGSGGHAIDQRAGLVYAQMPPAAVTEPVHLILAEADNLAVRERLRIPENLAGRAVLNSDGSVLYAISASGVTVFPVGRLATLPRLAASREDLLFQGQFCNRGVLTEEVQVTNLGGGSADYSARVCHGGAPNVCNPVDGVRVLSPAAGTLRVEVDPSVLQNFTGTQVHRLEISSRAAINYPADLAGVSPGSQVAARVRLLISSREPDQRGSIVNVPGRLVDLLADPLRNRFFVLRQDRNQVLVFDGATYRQIATLRTSNTPTHLALTFDRQNLLVGHDDSQLAYVFDLNTLEPQPPIRFPYGHYPRSLAASARALLGACRVAGPAHTIDRVDFLSRRASPFSSLGVWKNDVDPDTVLEAAPNGAHVMAAMPDGHVLLYDATADTFSVSRQDLESLSGGLAASSAGLYAAGDVLFNSSLVPIQVFPGAGHTTGVAFVDQTALRAGNDQGSGNLARLEVPSCQGALATRLAEAPLDLNTGVGGAAGAEAPVSVFVRSLAPLANRSAVIALSTSGFIVLPWNYEAPVAPPQITAVVSAADQSPAVAPGSLIAVYGSGLSAVTRPGSGLPLSTALAESCLTVNGVPLPVLYVSPGQINAQLPYSVEGSAMLVLRTPGGISDGIPLNIQAAAPAIFHTGTAGPETGIATVVRLRNNDFVTNANPIHPDDRIVIYLTGMGHTVPAVEAGRPAPRDPLAWVPMLPTVTLGGLPLAVTYAGLAPDQVGVYQINAAVPFRGVHTGFDIPLTVTQSGVATTVSVRVVD